MLVCLEGGSSECLYFQGRGTSVMVGLMIELLWLIGSERKEFGKNVHGLIKYCKTKKVHS